MEILKDVTYSVSPSKYGYKEVDEWVNGDKRVVLTTIWKSGSIDVTPRSDEEVDVLQKALSNDDDDVFKPFDFIDTEFQGSYDGYPEETELFGWSEEEEIDGTIDEIYDGLDEYDGADYLEENGYFVDESTVYFIGELKVEVVE